MKVQRKGPLELFPEGNTGDSKSSARCVVPQYKGSIYRRTWDVYTNPPFRRQKRRICTWRVPRLKRFTGSLQAQWSARYANSMHHPSQAFDHTSQTATLGKHSNKEAWQTKSWRSVINVVSGSGDHWNYQDTNRRNDATERGWDTNSVEDGKRIMSIEEGFSALL